MKTKMLLALALFTLSMVAFSETAQAPWVGGYTRKDGTQVRPHFRSSPNQTPRDNQDYRGNINIHTGERGYKKYRNHPGSEYYDGYEN